MLPQTIPTRLLTFIIVFLSAIAIGIVSVSAVVQTPQQSQPAEKTVEQVQKNIQVLKGLPQSQLTPLMNFISASLGVRCNFCHVNNNGQWDFASDEKPEKKAAREMILMVQGINKTNFNGNTDVSCYTCHRGRTRPQGVPELPVPSVTPRPEDTATATVEKPPTADEILARHLQAMGGAAAIDKIKTRALKGTLTRPDGTSLSYELYQSLPSKVLAVITTPQGLIERGFDGTSGWEKSQRGVRDLVEIESYYLSRYHDLLKDAKLKEQFSRVSYAGKEKIDGQDVYVLRGTSAGNLRERLFFDVQTGLLVRRVMITSTSIANIPEQVDFADYLEVDGVKMPFTIRISSIDPFFSITRKFTEIKLNVPVDEKRFVKPATGGGR